MSWALPARSALNGLHRRPAPRLAFCSSREDERKRLHFGGLSIKCLFGFVYTQDMKEIILDSYEILPKILVLSTNIVKTAFYTQNVEIYYL